MIDPARKLARTNNPRTSKAGAADVAPRLGQLQALVLEMVRSTPHRTSNELAREHKINDPRIVNRRLGELERDGYLVRGPEKVCSVSGRLAATWACSCSESQEKNQLSDGASLLRASSAPSRQNEQQAGKDAEKDSAGATDGAPDTTDPAGRRSPAGWLFDPSADGSRL